MPFFVPSKILTLSQKLILNDSKIQGGEAKNLNSARNDCLTIQLRELIKLTASQFLKNCGIDRFIVNLKFLTKTGHTANKQHYTRYIMKFSECLSFLKPMFINTNQSRFSLSGVRWGVREVKKLTPHFDFMTPHGKNF